MPKHEPVTEHEIKKLEDFLLAKPNILVLTGAGISTESGIPGKKSCNTERDKTTNHRNLFF